MATLTTYHTIPYPDLSEEVVREISDKIESSSSLFSDDDESESLVRLRSKYDLKVGMVEILKLLIVQCTCVKFIFIMKRHS